jgi:hypothetical protein
MYNASSRQEFTSLDMQLQFFLTKAEGVDLDTCIYKDNYRIALYSLYDFYVELWYNRTTKKLQKVTAFNSYKKLDTYLTSIDLTSIDNLLKS